MIKTLFKYLGGLVNNVETGQLSHSKLWANVAAGAATYKFIALPDCDAEIWIAYLGIVGGYAVAMKWIAAKNSDNSERQTDN
ncbi:hypothetical protein ABX022_01855 [Snodgrassella alvi]|uniref:hypothetical protein n=1 Tax=Snodgrassella alvi TaxID=1196083 RepID=UPI00351C3269